VRFKQVISAILISAFAIAAMAKPSTEYLPADADLDPSVPSPESQLGWELGDWRIQHPSLVRYMYTLAEKSDRVSIKVTGYTYERKPLLQLIITSPENQANIESLRETHLKAVESGDTKAPLVVWLGYSVHGDEASGANAVPIVAWYLAASRSDYVKNLLDNTIVIIDPSLNPDGLDRFAAWSNANHSDHASGDRSNRINYQDWPGGRTNHYLFDLNRDWLTLVHPESRARITEYHRWLPHLLTDHHETWHDGFFFQPGAPTRQHPLTTAKNLELTRALAAYHAESFDDAGEMYFSEDDYDDFFYGKGSTYPDINGSIGILFEQPRVNGTVLNRDAGPLKFSDAVHNQVRTSLSSLKGAFEMSDRFKQYQTGFFREMRQRADKTDFLAWVIGDGGEPGKGLELMNILRSHQVEFQTLAAEVSADGQTFKPGHAWVVPVKQTQFGVAQAMLETRTEFGDKVFYDISTWNLPLAYDLPLARLARLPSTTQNSPAPVSNTPDPDAAAWIIEWRQLNAPAVLQDLLDAGANVRAATKPFSIGNDSGLKSFGAGSLVLLAGLQDREKSTATLDLLRNADVSVQSFDTQLTTSGPGLGTSHFHKVKPVKPLLVVGQGTRAYDAGEAWFQLDQRLGVPPVLADMSRLKSIDLHDYTHLLMVEGRYGDISKTLKQDIVAWINDGGVLVTIQGAAVWAESLCFESGGCAEDKGAKEEAKLPVSPMAYGDFEDQEAELTISGAVVRASVDNSHPIAFGYGDELPLFRRGNVLLKASDNPFAAPVHYGEKPLMSGYVGEQRLAEMSGKPAVIAERHGKGLVVRFANNPIFRGYWRGTERLWVNSLYFGPLVGTTELPK